MVIHESALKNSRLLNHLKEDNLTVEEVQGSMVNSGVFALPKKYRSNQEFNKLLRLLSRYNDFIVHSDQSVISIWCLINKIKSSKEYIYNFQIVFVKSEVLFQIRLDQIIILHYAYFKPSKNFAPLLQAADFIVMAKKLFDDHS